MRVHRALTLALSCFLPASALAGQQVRIHGRVIANDSERPLEAAEVTLRRADGGFVKQIETDSTGTFEFVVTRVSAVRLRVERMGYKTNTTPLLHFDGKRYFEVEVRLDTDAILLAPLEVMVWSDVDRSPLMDGFRQRRAGGFGTYITRRQIEARRPMYTSDLLRTVPGVELVGGGSGHRPGVRLSRSAGKACTTQIFVDGMLVNRRGPDSAGDVRLDDVVSPASIEGIEIYRGLASIPAEFLNPDSECGVIAVWTRRGGAGR